MMINSLKYKFLLLGVLVISSCKYMSKNETHLKIDVAYLSQSKICTQDNKLPVELNEVFKPIDLNNLIGILEGKIYQLSTKSSDFISVSDSNYNSIVKIRHKFLTQDTYDATLKNYEDMLSNMNTQKLCTAESNSANAFENLNNLIKINGYSEILVLSLNIKDSLWNNYVVYNDVHILKNHITEVYKKSSQDKILVIVEPDEKDPHDVIVDTSEKAEGASPVNDGKIKEILQKINKLNVLSFSQRKVEVDKIVDSYFADQYAISVSFGNDSSVIKKFKNGRDYLDQLASNKHLKDIKVNHSEKDSYGRIKKIDIIEIQKNDIEVAIK